VKIRPLNDRVVVKRAPEETLSEGGIVIPDSSAEKPTKGEIVAVGEGKSNDNGSRSPMTVKVGDNVLFGQYAGTEIAVDGEKVLVMREDDILAIV
jgi:chaperonin GroES